jgi:hypothetical protein
MPCLPAMLRRYPNPVFIETGTYLGEGIDAAVEAGFERIFSIELGESLFVEASKKFSGNKKVSIIRGDSSKSLEPLISTITTTITFWLDAHCSLGNTAKGDKMCPLIEELAVISKHPIKKHTILVDDRHLLGSQYMEPTEEDVVRALKDINPSYRISYEDGAVKQDIIVAQIEEVNR